MSAPHRLASSKGFKFSIICLYNLSSDELKEKEKKRKGLIPSKVLGFLSFTLYLYFNEEEENLCILCLRIVSERDGDDCRSESKDEF